MRIDYLIYFLNVTQTRSIKYLQNSFIYPSRA